jgi:hypothetical protein
MRFCEWASRMSGWWASGLVFSGLSLGVWVSVLVIERVDCPVGGRVVWCSVG